MLKLASLWLLAILVALADSKAAGPTIFEDGWSPVHASQVVELPRGIPKANSQPVAIERAPQEPQVNEDRADVDVAEVDIEEVSPLDEEPKVEEEVDEPSDRIDVVEERVSTHNGANAAANFVDKDQQIHSGKPQSHDYQEEDEEVEEGETAAPPVRPANVRPEADETPLIVYPSGTVPQYFGQEDQQQQQQQQLEEEEGLEEGEGEVPPQYAQGGPQDPRVPRPPQQGRYPIPPPPPGRAPLVPRRPPPPGNWRRPPPPGAQPYPPPPPPEGYPRNVPEDEILPEAAAPRQSPFEQGPPRPRPRPENNGGILGSIGSTLGNIAGNIKCGAEDVAADVRLQDEAFMQRQLDCVLDKGPCDELGANVKRLAPDIMRGICPHPCDECKKGKIQKVMSTIARKYPKQWNEMVREFGRRAQQRQRRRD